MDNNAMGIDPNEEKRCVRLDMIKTRFLKAVPIMFIITAFLLYLSYVGRVSYNVPHMDAWKGLSAITEKYMEGNITFNDWMPIPHGEYYSMLGVPMYYVMIVILHMNFQALTYAAALFLLIESFVIFSSYSRAIESKSNGTKYAYYFLFVLLLFPVFNLNQWEIASFYCAFEYFLRISFYCYMFSFIDKLLHLPQKRIRDYVHGGILCVVAILVISHAYFPGAIAVVALTMIFDYLHKREWKNIWYYLIVAAFVVAAGIFYIATYSTVQSPAGSTVEQVSIMEKLLSLLKAVVLMSAAPLIHQSSANGMTVYYIVGVCNIVVSIICTIAYFLKKEHKNSYMPLMLMLYGYLSITIIAFVRLERFEISYVTSSRYVVESTLIILGNIWILVGLLADVFNKRNPSKSKYVVAITATALAFLTTIGIIRADVTEWKIAPYRQDSFRQVAYYMLNIDFISDEELGITQAPASDVREAVKTIKKYNLNVFHDLPYSKELQSMLIDTLSPNQYKFHSGVYSDGWITVDSTFFVKAENEETVTLRGFYPFEITGKETITVKVGDTVVQHTISAAEFEIAIPVIKNQLVQVNLVCDFKVVNPPDVRELCFLFLGIDGLQQVG